MIDEVDEAFRKLLLLGLREQRNPGERSDLQNENVDNNVVEEVDIAFEQPRRAWSSRLTRPTLNLFLHDVRENVLMRQMAQPEVRRNGNGIVTERRNPMRVDLTYLITAWASHPLDEHRMLGRTLLALGRYLTIPTNLLSENLKVDGLPVNVQVAREEASGLGKPMELWSALDNEARPAISCLITAPFNPFQKFDSPMVQVARVTYFDKDKREPHVYADERDKNGRVMRYQNVESRTRIPANLTVEEDRNASVQRYVRGCIRRADGGPMSQVTARLAERNSNVLLDDEGFFMLWDLAPGNYHLEVQVDYRPAQKCEFAVPTAQGPAQEQLVIEV